MFGINEVRVMGTENLNIKSGIVDMKKEMLKSQKYITGDRVYLLEALDVSLDDDSKILHLNSGDELEIIDINLKSQFMQYYDYIHGAELLSQVKRSASDVDFIYTLKDINTGRQFDCEARKFDKSTRCIMNKVESMGSKLGDIRTIRDILLPTCIFASILVVGMILALIIVNTVGDTTSNPELLRSMPYLVVSSIVLLLTIVSTIIIPIIMKSKYVKMLNDCAINEHVNFDANRILESNIK